MGVKLFSGSIGNPVSLRDLRGKKIAIDASLFLHQFLTSIRQPDGTLLTNSKGNVTSHVIGLFYRTTKLMTEGIQVCYVFDGEAPDLKKKEIARRKEAKQQAHQAYRRAEEEGDTAAMKKYSARTVKLTPSMITQAKELLQLLGIPIVQAPSEAEAQAAHLNRSGDVYAVASQDADTLVFGAKRLIRNLAISGRKKRGMHTRTIQPELIELKRMLNEWNLTQDQLVVYAMLIGTDFNPGGIPGIGPKKALKAVQDTSHNFDALFASVEWKKYFDVTWKDVYNVFSSLPVRTDITLNWSQPQWSALRNTLIDEYEFSADRVNSTLKRLEEHKDAQKGLGDFL